jgi:hypothetical protein
VQNVGQVRGINRESLKMSSSEGTASDDTKMEEAFAPRMSKRCPTVKFTVRTSACVCNYPADVFLPSAPTVKNASVRTCPCVRADGLMHLCARTRVRADISTSARTHSHPHGHQGVRRVVIDDGRGRKPII